MLSAWFILCLPGCRAACVQDMKGSPLASLVQPPPVFSSGTRVRRFPRLHRWPVAGAVASHPQCRFPSVAGTTATLLLLCTPSDDCRMANALGDRRSTRHSITGGFPPPGIRSGGNRHFERLKLRVAEVEPQPLSVAPAPGRATAAAPRKGSHRTSHLVLAWRSIAADVLTHSPSSSSPREILAPRAHTREQPRRAWGGGWRRGAEFTGCGSGHGTASRRPCSDCGWEA